jgi:hypothetical protein
LSDFSKEFYHWLAVCGNEAQRLVYELWRVKARTSPNKNWLWKIRRIFQVGTDQAIAYILC